MANLYVVATPIGNLQDITLRAIEVLKTVDFICAEDTRHTRQLLAHLGISQSLLALHEHNENTRFSSIIEKLQAGQSAALVSDAGTPLISDPGFLLVQAAKRHDIPVVPIPGACALIAALSVSGLPTHAFIFEGFLPPKGEKRKKRLESLADETRTLIFYESVHRIGDLMQQALAIFGGEREATLARELTKTYENIYTAKLQALHDWFFSAESVHKGEFVLLIAGNSESQSGDQKSSDHVLQVLLQELSLKQSVKLAQQLTGESRKQLYQRALGISGK